MEIENSVFVEKYRPNKLDDLIGNNELKSKFKEYLDKGEIPNLLLFGSAGTGKTSLSKIIVNNLDCNFLYINASDENSVDIMREKIKNFAMTRSFNKWKIVILDECDKITSAASSAFKVILEEYYKTCRFILITNLINKIDDPIKSRCVQYNFKLSSFDDVKKRILYILNNENIKYSEKELDLLIKSTQGDLRQLINKIQKHTINNELKISKDILLEDNIQKVILALIKKADNESLNKIRKLIGSIYNFDYISMFEYLFQNIEYIGNEQNRGDIIIILAEYQDLYINAIIKSIPFIAMCQKIMQLTKIF